MRSWSSCRVQVAGSSASRAPTPGLELHTDQSGRSPPASQSPWLSSLVTPSPPHFEHLSMRSGIFESRAEICGQAGRGLSRTGDRRYNSRTLSQCWLTKNCTDGPDSVRLWVIRCGWRWLSRWLPATALPHHWSAELGVSSNLMAHHVAILVDAGIVTRQPSEADRRRVCSN